MLAQVEAWKNDLPDGFEPMTAKELRQSLRRHSFVLPYMAIHLGAVLAIATEFADAYRSGYSGRTEAGLLNVALLFTSGPFWIVATAVCMGIMPMAGILLMGQEIEAGNHELLLLTHLSRWRIVIGKFACLWGLCALTFLSLMPYVVVRYLIGGIEWWHEAACAGTVLAGSAMVAAGALAASGFKKALGKFTVALVFVASMLITIGGTLGGAAFHGIGIHYHLTALAGVICYCSLGLALARSKLRLAVLAYEANPSATLIGVLIFAPFVAGFFTVITVGWGGVLALAAIAFVAIRADRTPGSAAAPFIGPPPVTPDY